MLFRSNIYEVHLGSWKKRDNGDYIDYRDLARDLAAYKMIAPFWACHYGPLTTSKGPNDDVKWA